MRRTPSEQIQFAPPHQADLNEGSALREQPLTISAEGKSYVLPPVKVPRWRARFQKIC